MLGYIDSKEKRRRILTQLNRRNSGTGWPAASATATAAKSGRPTVRNRKSSSAPSASSLNAIALWNATYIQAALDQLAREGWDVSPLDIARISPLTFKHINFLGRYAFDLPQAVAEGALRPLRNPNSE